MKILFDPQNSMKEFHQDKTLNKLVEICFMNKNNQIFYDVIDLIFLKDYAAVNMTLNLLRQDYFMRDEMEIYNDFKECFDEIYKKQTRDNLRGAFLELLSYRLFAHEYKYVDCSTDCRVIIDGWKSKYTVDVAMICDSNALACETKISESNFSKKIFDNLLSIKNKSNDYFSVCIVTLVNKTAITKKIDEISKDFSNPNDLNKIHVFTRNDLANFSFGN